MAFTHVRLSDLVTRQIQSWALPDQIQIELYLHLTRVLPADIEHNLVRVNSPFNGMMTECVRRDPNVNGRDHSCVFLVYFGQDEETLIIERGHYQRITTT